MLLQAVKDFCMACKEGNSENAQQLLRFRSNPVDLLQEAMTQIDLPLYLAVIYNNFAVTRMLGGSL